MIPRSWITSHADGARVPAGKPLAVRGIAMGGDVGVKSVALSIDGGRSWADATLGHDEGKYSFRRFEATLPAPAAGALTLLPRCTSTAGVIQSMEPIWNSGGYLRGQVEPTRIVVA
jgi:hypothetical protein